MTFKDAVKIILKHEGGYVNDPVDPGGETNMGISKKAYPYLNIKELTKKDAEEFAAQVSQMEDSGRSHATGPDFKHDLKHHDLDPGRKGPNDLEQIISEQKKRIAQLEGISKVHRAMNGELRKELYEWKMKAAQTANLDSQITGQKKIIEELTKDNYRLADQVDNQIQQLKKAGVI